MARSASLGLPLSRIQAVDHEVDPSRAQRLAGAPATRQVAYAKARGIDGGDRSTGSTGGVALNCILAAAQRTLTRNY